MVKAIIKKKVMLHFKLKIKSKMMNDIHKIKMKKNFNEQNIFADIIIHLYCLKKNIQSPIDPHNKSKIILKIKDSCERINNKRKYSLISSDLLVNHLINYYTSCLKNKKNCIFLSAIKFIQKVSIAESLLNLKSI